MVEKTEKKSKEKKTEHKNYTVNDLINKFNAGISKPKNKR